MAAGENDQEKTEDPTPQRREDFRRRGQIAQSKEIGAVLILLASLIAIWALSRFSCSSFSKYLRVHSPILS